MATDNSFPHTVTYHGLMARSDDEAQPTAQQTSVPSTEPVHPAVEVLLPNLNRVSGSTFRRGSLSRHRVNVALGILAGVAVLTTLLILFADVIFATFWTWFGVLLLAVAVVAIVGLALSMADEQRTRRSHHDDSDLG